MIARRVLQAAVLTLMLLALPGALPPPADAGAPVVARQPARTPSQPGESCVGHWTGVALQPGYPPWSIDMVVTATTGDPCGRIEYPTLGCGGELRACAGTRGHFHSLERYAHNAGLCAPAGAVEAVCVGDAMHWTWTGMLTQAAELHRQ